ncbi:MAG: beta-eliminating lyase-related protein [Eubacteriales bacterium]|nr:beta-eliminating lyase-related protein [Eubacteriales bacterium]
MIRFECDYAEGCHPAILEALAQTNLEQTVGYGLDDHCEHARQLIRKACAAPEAGVHFLVGGTQANATVISACLKPYQGAIAAQTGHINVHETGAIEALGHKVLPLPSDDGKITAEQIMACCRAHYNDATHEHMVQPGMVYISQPTENGTLYTKAELNAIRLACTQYSLRLFIDGARCGYGLVAPGNDVTLADLARISDVFYIGGTKVGALFGEAVVITSEALNHDFRYYIKRHGGMLAKGRLLGIQFETLMSENRYEQIAAHGVELAWELRRAFEECGVRLLYDSPTNQQFPILRTEELSKLQKKYAFSFWQQMGEGWAAVRVCTSWATDAQAVRNLIQDVHDVCRR